MDRSLYLKYVIILVLIFNFLYSTDDISSLKKEKLEVIHLKKELNYFYNQKEKENNEREKKLNKLAQQIQRNKKEIQTLYDKNLQLLQDIKQTIIGKTAKVYNGMKPKIAASIFNEMIDEGKIEDVFDIIIRLKDKKITALMKYLSVSNASLITQMMKNYKAKNKE